MDSNREIILRLRKVLSGKVLPEMQAWRSRYLRATQSTEQVENLEEWKLNSIAAARSAIGEILKFCEEEEGLASDEDPNQLRSLLKKLVRMGRRWFRK